MSSFLSSLLKIIKPFDQWNKAKQNTTINNGEDTIVLINLSANQCESKFKLAEIMQAANKIAPTIIKAVPQIVFFIIYSFQN